MKTSQFPSIVRSWLLSVEAEREGAPGTLAMYRTIIKQFLDIVGVPPEEVTSDDVLRYMIEMRKVVYFKKGQPGKKYSPSTLHNRFVVVRCFFKWAVKKRVLPTNPTDDISRPSVPDDMPLKTLSLEQLRALMRVPTSDRFATRDRAILLILADTGIRRNECTGINLDDLDLDSGLILIHGKGRGRRRHVQLGASSRLALESYLRLRARSPYADDPHLFLGMFGPLREGGMEHLLQRNGKRIGVPGLHPHMMRHSWAAHAMRAGVEDSDMMTLGGWRTPAMLRRYGRDDAQARALEAYKGRSVADRIRSAGPR